MFKNFKTYGVVAIMAVSVNVHAEEFEQRCRAVAATTAAEIKAGAAEPMSAAALGAARDGAFRGCMVSLNTPEAAVNTPSPSDASTLAGSGTANAGSETGGFFNFLNRESKRTRGHKRLQQRGK